MKFNELCIDKKIISALDVLGYDTLLPVQEKVIPCLLNRKDCVVQSKTGSGKTAAFVVPIVQNLIVDERSPQVLVLTPTRELSLQVQEEFDHIGTYKKIKTLLLVGKQPFAFQRKDLKQRCHVVIGTPGRVLDHLNEGNMDVSKISYVVIDEADEMLNMNFLEQVQGILEHITSIHTTCLLSATFPRAILRMVEKYVHDHEMIQMNAQQVNIDEVFYKVHEDEKADFLVHLLSDLKPESCMIFCKTQERVDQVDQWLHGYSLSVDKLHGGMMQDERLAHIKAFKQGHIRMLVCTDVAARGIDVFKVDLVINYDMPSPVQTYTHRIGRSGRVDQSGLAISLVSEFDDVRVAKLEAYLKHDLEYYDPSIVFSYPLSGLDDLKISTRIVEDKSLDLRKDIMTLYISAGKKKKIRPGDIVGAICQIDGIGMDDIGVINVQDGQSFVDILHGKADLVISSLSSIKGKSVRVEFKR